MCALFPIFKTFLELSFCHFDGNCHKRRGSGKSFSGRHGSIVRSFLLQMSQTSSPPSSPFSKEYCSELRRYEKDIMAHNLNRRSLYWPSPMTLHHLFRGREFEVFHDKGNLNWKFGSILKSNISSTVVHPWCFGEPKPGDMYIELLIDENMNAIGKYPD